MKKEHKVVVAVIGFVVLAIIGLVTGCGKVSPTGNASPITSGSALASAGGSPAFTATSAPTRSAVVTKAKAKPPSRWGSLPARSITPGAGELSLAAICPSVSATLEARRPSTSVKDEVYDEYGIAAGQRHRYRIDHLVPLELDGSNSIRNLWPQLIAASRAKDRLEDTLHSMVCAGKITLADAQHAIATNWVRAYHWYVSPPTASSAAPAPPQTTAPAAVPSTPSGCYPLTNGGNCYEPGEYCRNSDHGISGVAGDGERIICEDNNGWRWEPA
jgi:hypothetical protein